MGKNPKKTKKNMMKTNQGGLIVDNNVFEELDKIYEEDRGSIDMKNFVDTSIVLIVQDAETYDVKQVDRLFEDEMTSEELAEARAPAGERTPENDNTRIISTPEDVRDTLMKLQTLVDYRILPSYKNRAFKGAHGFTDADIECICKQLAIGDYVCTKISDTPAHAGCPLPVFIPNKDFTLADGRVIHGLIIYIKFDFCASSRVTVVSFHDPLYEESHPYEE